MYFKVLSCSNGFCINAIGYNFFVFISVLSYKLGTSGDNVG
jgi:hypothetical protein